MISLEYIVKTVGTVTNNVAFRIKEQETDLLGITSAYI